MAEAQKLPQFFAAICICIGAMGTGTVIAWTSNVGKKLEGGDLNGIKLDLSYAGAAMCFGATCVCIPIGIMAEKLGRKLTVLFIIIPFVLGWVLIIFTQHGLMLLAGRFLTGMAGGSFCIVGPLYTSEIAQNEIRGTLGTFMQLFITIGILYSNLLGWILPLTLYCILCAAVPCVFGLLFMIQPETPPYLIKHGQKDKAIAAFTRLRGKDYDPSGEIAEIERQAAKEEELKDQFGEQLKSVQGKKASTICFMLMFYQQLSGINAVMFYSGSIFRDAGSTIQPELCATIIGVVQVIATLFSAWSIDKLGRKVLLMISGGLMSVSTLMMSMFFLVKNFELMSDITKIGFLPLISLMLFIIAFSVGMGPIPWLASSEIFPPAIMARMSSLAGMFNWFLATCVTMGFGPANTLLGAHTSFLVFSIVSGTAVFFVLLVIPETKGKTFQEIQDELGGVQ